LDDDVHYLPQSILLPMFNLLLQFTTEILTELPVGSDGGMPNRPVLPAERLLQRPFAGFFRCEAAAPSCCRLRRGFAAAG